VSLLFIAVPVLPLLAAPLSLLFGWRLPWRGGELVVGMTVLALAALLLLEGQHQTLQTSWFESGGFRLTVGLDLSGLTWFAATVVAGVSLLIGIYSLGYMASEHDRPRFFAELALFIGAMLTLVLASSLILLFAAWEAVGIASYLLIGFRQEPEAARPAAAKAFLMTRLGDLGLLMGWLLVLLALRTTDIAALLAAVSQGAISPGMLTAIGLLLFLGAIGKSAQLPLTAWLPDAMVAPTPVSALIHSATMVAAGVYLLLRLYPLFAAAPGVLHVVFWVGAATAVLYGFVSGG
jgi:NADH-quinone oxidoreductase subunit L